MQVWFIVLGVLFLVFLVIVVSVLMSAKQRIVVMREGHRIEVVIKSMSAQLLIDGSVSDEVASLRNGAKLIGHADDLDVKVNISTGAFKPLVKIFVNNEFIEL